MNKLFYYTLAAVLLVTSCTKDRITGSGPITTEDRSISNFTKVKADGANNIHISQGAAFKLQVKGYSNLVPHMETVVTNNTLRIGYKDGINVKNDNLEIFITLPLLQEVAKNGSGNVDIKGFFTGADLHTVLSGSGNIDIEAGDVPFLKTSINGSGNISAFGVTADRADVSISGSGNTEVRAITNLKVNIAGSGNVYYKGTPVTDVTISGSGQLIHRP